MRVTVATSQFPVSADVRRNAKYVLNHMDAAKERGADVIHFGEGALSGYAGVDFSSFDNFDWPVLEECTERVLERAQRLGIWTLVGSAHRLTHPNKPHNSVYVIDDGGRLVDRYDKRFCAGDRTEDTGDLAHFSPGDHESVFEIRGVRCGVLICHEYRYPELYREYKRRGVALIFHSFHTGNAIAERFERMGDQVGREYHNLNRGPTLPAITMPAASQAAAASSHMWISCSNSSARESCWGAFFVRADGVITGRLSRNRAGVLLSTVDTDQPLYDSTVAWRENAMNGVFHSGTLVEDERSKRRTTI